MGFASSHFIVEPKRPRHCDIAGLWKHTVEMRFLTLPFPPYPHPIARPHWAQKLHGPDRAAWSDPVADDRKEHGIEQQSARYDWVARKMARSRWMILSKTDLDRLRH
jgi:hypothetical protein